jgi:hypothetical protein
MNYKLSGFKTLLIPNDVSEHDPEPVHSILTFYSLKSTFILSSQFLVDL